MLSSFPDLLGNSTRPSGSLCAMAKADVWCQTHEPFPSAERRWGSPGVFVQVFEMQDATGKPNKKVLVEYKARKSDIVTFNPSPCTSVLFQVVRQGRADISGQGKVYEP